MVGAIPPERNTIFLTRAETSRMRKALKPGED